MWRWIVGLLVSLAALAGAFIHWRWSGIGWVLLVALGIALVWAGLVYWALRDWEKNGGL